jgi:hypothetical protein
MLMYERLLPELPLEQSDDDDVDTVTTEPVSLREVDSPKTELQKDEFVEVAETGSPRPSFDTPFSQPQTAFELEVY